MSYTLDDLNAGIIQAEKDGDDQALRLLATERAKLLKAQEKPAAPSSAENIGAGVIEGFAGLPDMALQGGTWLGKKTGLVDEATQAPQIGSAFSDFVGLHPDRSSLEYLGGNIVGGAAMGGAGAVRSAAGLGGKALAAGKILGKEAVATGGAMAGAPVGEAVGTMADNYFGTDVFGDMGGVAGAFAGAAAPSAAIKGTKQGAHLAFRKADGKSADVYNAAKRQGVTPSVGLVGNRGASYLENAMGLIPVVGSEIANTRTGQVDATGNILRDSAGLMRSSGGQEPTPLAVVSEPTRLENNEPVKPKSFPANPDVWKAGDRSAGVTPFDVGSQIQEIARQGSARALDNLGRRDDALEYTIGPDTPVQVGPVSDLLANMHSNAGSESLMSTIEADQRGLQNLHGRYLSENFPQDLADINAEKSSLQDINGKMGRIDEMMFDNSARGISGAEQQNLQDTMDIFSQDAADHQSTLSGLNAALKAKLPDKTMALYGPLRNWRSGIGYGTNGSIPMNAGEKKKVYGATTTQLQGAAEDAGAGKEFGDLMTDWSFAHNRDGGYDKGGYLKTADRLVDKPTADSAYNWLHNGPNRSVEKFNVLAQLAGAGNKDMGFQSPQYRQFLGDYIESTGRATPGQQNAAGDQFSPATFSTNWAKADPGVREIIRQADPSPGPTSMSGKFEDALTLSNALKDAGKAANPSGTTAMAIPAALGAGLVSNPLGVLGPIGGSWALKRALLSDIGSRAVAFGNEGGSLSDIFTRGNGFNYANTSAANALVERR